MKKLLKKYESIISYGFFGVCTTLVNIIVYYLFAHILHFSTVISTIYAWFFAVTFALITNKIWVFKSKSWDTNTVIKETLSFFSCRLLTGLLDILIMVLFVDVIGFNDIVIKTLSNIIVIILNYVASKLIIFNDKVKFDYKKVLPNVLVIFSLLFMSFIVVMQSPLNYFNISSYSGSDSSVFRSIGIFMQEGLMPYRDLFDHKGPLIYLINYFGQLISFNYGVWLIEFFFLFITFSFMYKSSRLFCNRLFSFIVTLVSASLLFLYYEGGNLTEEYALPFIAVSFYIFLDYFKNNKITKLRLIICGLSFGAVFLLRINMVTLWFIFSISVLIKCLMNKNYKDLFKFILYFLIGFLIISLPIFIWLLMNNSFNDFIYDYFIFNTIYSSDARMYEKVKTLFFFFNKYIILLSFIISLYLVYKKRESLSITYLICFIFTMLFISMSGREYYHYGMILIPLLIYPFSILFEKISLGSKSNSLVLFIPLFLICYLALPVWIDGCLNSLKVYENYVTGENTIKQTAVYKISRDIKKNSTSDDKITVYGLNNIIYIMSKRQSVSKYTYQYPITEIDDNISKEYFNDLNNNLPKLVVIAKEDNDINNFIYKNNYSLISVYGNLKLYKK